MPASSEREQNRMDVCGHKRLATVDSKEAQGYIYFII